MVKTLLNDELEVVELAVEHVVRCRLVHFRLDHLDVTVDETFPLQGIEPCVRFGHRGCSGWHSHYLGLRL